MIRLILALISAILYLLVGIPWLAIEKSRAKKDPVASDKRCFHGIQWILTVMCLKCGGIKLDVRGLENIPKDEAVLYVGNHNSALDPLLLYPLFPDRTGFVAKISTKKIPLVKNWMEKLHCLFIDRDDMKQSLKVILDAIAIVKSGVSVCIFPEGTRGATDEMIPFKEGSLKIADKTGCAIVPIAMTGTRKTFPLKPYPALKPVKVIIEFGKPIYPKELEKEQRKFMGKLSQEVVAEMLEKHQSELAK